MEALQYVSVNSNGYSYSSLPYYFKTNTKVVFKDLYVPLQSSSQGINLFTAGPGRFQATGNGLDAGGVKTDDQYLRVNFGYYTGGGSPSTPFYMLSWEIPNGIDGDLEIGNAYIKLNGNVVATATTYTGTAVTLTQPFYLFNSFNSSWSHNYIREGHVGQISFYENDVLVARFTPYLDDNNRAGFYDEFNHTMIYSLRNDWVAGPPASSIKVVPTSKIVKTTGDTFSINVKTDNSWTASTLDGTWITMSATAGTSADTAITITVPSYTGDTDRTDEITFTDEVTGDYAVFYLKQKKYQTGIPLHVGGDEVFEIYIGGSAVTEAYLGEDQVYKASSIEYLGSVYAYDVDTWNIDTFLDTGIAHTASTITCEIECFIMDEYIDRIIGYYEDDGASSEFRWFNNMDGYFDYTEDFRDDTLPTTAVGCYHITIGDCFVYDNDAEDYLVNSTPLEVVPDENAHILIDISRTKVKRVIIKDGNTVLFDGSAAKIGNNIGLYDTVSNSLIYNPDIEMAYDTAQYISDQCTCIANGGTWEDDECIMPEEEE